MAKRKNKNILLKIILTTLILGGIGVGGYYAVNHFIESSEQDKQTDPLQLKMLSESVLDDGTIRKVLSYTITPEDATNKEVKVTAEYEDGSLCDDVVSCWTSTSNLQIGLDFKSDFDKKIIITITSAYDSKIKTTITCDYEKDLVDFKMKKNEGGKVLYKLDIGYNEGEANSLTIDNFIDITYSKYTLDKDYTFKLELDYFQLHSDNYGEFQALEQSGIYPHISSFLSNNSPFYTLLKTKLLELNSLPTAEELWNLSVEEDYSDEWHSFLLDTKGYNIWSYNLKGYFKAYDGNTELYSVEICNDDETHSEGFNLFFDFSNIDYSEFVIPTESIAVENNYLII